MHIFIRGYMNTWLQGYVHTCMHTYIHTCILADMSTWYIWTYEHWFLPSFPSITHSSIPASIHPSIHFRLLRPWRLGGTCPRACQVQWCGVHPGDKTRVFSEGWNHGAISPQKIVTSVGHDTKTQRSGGKLSSGTHIGSKARVFQSRWQVKSGESQKGGKANMVMQLLRITMCAPQTPESDRVFLTKLHVFKKPGRAALSVSRCGGQTIGMIFCQCEWAGRMALILELTLESRHWGDLQTYFWSCWGVPVFPLENFLWLLTKDPSAEASAKRLTLGMEGSGERENVDCLWWLAVSPISGRFSDLWTYDTFIEFHTYIVGLGTQPSCSAKLDCFTSLSFGSAFSLE